MFEESGEKMAAKETIMTIHNLRDRVNTWYGGGAGAWLSASVEFAGDDDTETDFSSRGETLGLGLNDWIVTPGSLRVSVELSWDKVMMKMCYGI
jgi:hypothetical protein